MNRFSECGVKGVEVNQTVRGDSVEGQNTSRTVHVHGYSVSGRRGGGRVGGRHASVIVPHRTRATITVAFQSPGLIVPSKHAVFTVAFPFNSSVTH